MYKPYENFNLDWDTSILSQVLNCGGVVLEIYFDHKFQWLREGLKCKSFPYEVVT